MTRYSSEPATPHQLTWHIKQTDTHLGEFRQIIYISHFKRRLDIQGGTDVSCDFHIIHLHQAKDLSFPRDSKTVPKRDRSVD